MSASPVSRCAKSAAAEPELALLKMPYSCTSQDWYIGCSWPAYGHKGKTKMTNFNLRGLAAAAVLATAFMPAAMAAEPGACTARHAETWTAAGQAYTIEAFAEGPKCEQAVAALVIRGPDGTPVWSSVFEAANVMVLAGMPDQAAFRQAIADWIKPDAERPTSASLPEWKAGADGPVLGDFAFYPEDGIDRDAYEAIRKANLPMVSFVQGMESVACLVLQDGAFVKVGAQSFPG